MPPTESPTRRVLGSKTTNTTIRAHSPLKSTKHAEAAHFDLTTNFDSKLQPVARVGQKRSIDEVEDAERVESQENNSQQSAETHALSLPSDTSFGSEVPSTSAVEDSKTTSVTEIISFGPSQPEITFEILEDEPSQNTRDSWNAVTLPQNASQPQGLRPLLMKNLSQTSAGMSSFVDFDQNLSQSDDLQLIERIIDVEVASKEATEIALDDARDRRERVNAQAEQLRTRLQLAFYKVTTNQTTTPFSRLRKHTGSMSPEPMLQPMSSSPPSSPAAPQRPSLETRMAIAKAKATMQSKKPVKSLDSVHMPTIIPTTFSARTMDPAALTKQMPSSPPQSRQTSTDGADDTPRAPVRPLDVHKLPKTPMQLTSPPGSPEQSKRNTTSEGVAHHDRNDRYQTLTSSTVKGDAANMLLKLMTAGKDECIKVGCENALLLPARAQEPGVDRSMLRQSLKLHSQLSLLQCI